MMNSDQSLPDVVVSVRCALPPSTIWSHLLGERGLCARGMLLDLKQGDRFSIETAAGDLLEGTIAALDHSAKLRLIAENMYDSELEAMVVPVEDEVGVQRVTIALFAAGLHHDEVESYRLRWRLVLTDLFGGAIDEDHCRMS